MNKCPDYKEIQTYVFRGTKGNELCNFFSNREKVRGNDKASGAKC